MCKVKKKEKGKFRQSRVKTCHSQKKQLRFGPFCMFIQTKSQRSEHAWYD